MSLMVNAVQAEEEMDAVTRMINHFSSWIHLKKMVGWILKFKSLLLSQKRKQLSVTLAQYGLDKDQQERKMKDMQSIKAQTVSGSLLIEESEKLRWRLSAFVKGRDFQMNSTACKREKLEDDLVEELCLKSKHPAILAKDLHISDIILQHIHQEVGHRNHMLSSLRQRYWIPGASVAIRKILSKCIVCRRLHAAPGHQQIADLPRDRVSPDEPPFTCVGVDYFGPFEVKRGRSTAKKPGVLFTCLSVRAIHIKVASLLDIDSFINALRCFIARRGQVLELRSDNGTNFVRAERELREVMESWNLASINDTLQKGIKWIFSPPTGSHHGGVWERLIRSVRKVLNSSLKVQNLDEEGLHTVLCEAEAIINSRPITKASTDPNDLEVLTPNHLLLLKTMPSFPPGQFQKEDTYARRRWKQVQCMSNLFWKRWITSTSGVSEVVKCQAQLHFLRYLGDSAPHNSWLTGRIVQTTPNRRGLVRQVRIKTKTSYLDRPITKVCLLQEAEEPGEHAAAL
ncbi:hypothetical protein N1851_018296 [Merluccius polli]|uniref:Integrase catalytic domain-containing protein n=1 Tax=Merluccius polli TaxID=89951 RepID=A0AA47NYG7_MERPO|nr:hypothetical protein N1851_018296 [Merluccius polli]